MRIAEPFVHGLDQLAHRFPSEKEPLSCSASALALYYSTSRIEERMNAFGQMPLAPDGLGTTRIVPPLRGLPEADNTAGAPEVLLQINAEMRKRPWPHPYDRTRHVLRVGDARTLSGIADETVHLIVTSPPYFNLKPYASDAGGRQLGRIRDYEEFLEMLDQVWAECHRVLVPGGRVCCVVGDVLVPRRAGGRHWVLPLPADIQVRSRRIGLDNLTPILWHKIANRTNEAGGGSSGFYGKPYQPGAVIKNDHEHILMLRKAGGYRQTPMVQKALSMIQRDEMDAWMRPVWSDIRGASLRDGHPAPFPVSLAERLIRMFSFAGDVVLDPFAGSGSTAIAAIQAGRNSISVEVEKEYILLAERRVRKQIALTAIAGVQAPIAHVTVET
jgi:site-specific DNA-methyltransferase (adenine-specific)